MLFDDEDRDLEEETGQETGDDGCDESEDCGEESDGRGEGKGKKTGSRAAARQTPSTPAKTPAKPASSPAPAQARFIYPFNVRYAAEILDLTGFVDGQEYAELDIKQLLIQNGYTEFADIEPAFHRSEATNTLVITIKGSKKGALAKIPWKLLTQIESLFISTFHFEGTEDRVLVYGDGAGDLILVRPPMAKHAKSVQGDVPLAIEWDGSLWDLAFDLHSHHVMGLGWSDTDNANERIRGPVFGVLSWQDGRPRWLFRRFAGQFEDVPYSEVVEGD